LRKFNLLDAMILVAATAAGMAFLRMFLAEGRFSPVTIFQGWSLTSRVLSGIETAYPFLVMWTFALVILRLRQPRPRMRRLARQPGMAAGCAASLMLVVQLLGIVPFDILWSMRCMMAQPSTPMIMPPVKMPIGFNTPPGKTNVPNGARTPSHSPDSAGAVASLPQQGQPPGIFPSLPSAPTQPVGFWPTWYIIRGIHVHMIQRGYVAAAVAGAWFVLFFAGWWRPEPSWIDRSGRVLGFLWIVPYLIYHADLSRLWS
jgi:hypothetical protein